MNCRLTSISSSVGSARLPRNGWRVARRFAATPLTPGETQGRSVPETSNTRCTCCQLYRVTLQRTAYSGHQKRSHPAWYDNICHNTRDAKCDSGQYIWRRTLNNGKEVCLGKDFELAVGPLVLRPCADDDFVVLLRCIGWSYCPTQKLVFAQRCVAVV